MSKDLVYASDVDWIHLMSSRITTVYMHVCGSSSIPTNMAENDRRDYSNSATHLACGKQDRDSITYFSPGEFSML